MRHEPPPREAESVASPLLAQDELATLQVLRAAMNVLALQHTVDRAFLASLKPLQALIAASREVVEELGFGDEQEA